MSNVKCNAFILDQNSELTINCISIILQAEDSVDDDVLNAFCWMYRDAK